MKKLLFALKRLKTPVLSGFIIRRQIPKNIDVVLECADGDRGIYVENLAYAQILDYFQDELIQNGLNCITLAVPGSVILSKRAYGHVISFSTVLEEIIIFGLKIFSKLTKGLIGQNTYETNIYETVFISRLFSRY